MEKIIILNHSSDEMRLILIFYFWICIKFIDTFTDDNNNRNICFNRNVTALILARGGSKGIPLKNLVTINGTSLLGRTIREIQNSKQFHQIWVSTDHQKIGEEAINFGANLHIRPDHLAQDTTPSIDAVQEFLEKHQNITHLVLVQCTSVFLRSKYLIEAVQKFYDSDCVFAVTRSHKLRWKYEKEMTKLMPINFNPNKRPRRQDWSGELIETGMFYFAKRHLLLAGVFQNDQCKAVEIEYKDALEIDSPDDLKLARFLIDL